MPRPPQRLHHGVAYYPELWPDDQIDRDIAEMRKLGLTVARIAEFAWAKMEPDEGAIDLKYFQRVMDKLHESGIRVVLCTPTATPPIWLTHGQPERRHVDATGAIMSHGSRQHVCYEHPDVRAASRRIVQSLARTLGQHPALEAWQIDNEFKCHVSEDFNPSTIACWHGWLERKFGSISQLNDAWGAEIWSQRYQRFDQVPAPAKAPFLHSASLSTAYRIFSREMIAEFMNEQIGEIRRHSNAPITHNFGLSFALDLELMGQNLDFVSWDDYPAASDWRRIILQCDLFRAAKPERAFWLMETSAAHNGCLTNYEPAHPAGFLRAEAVAAFALGAEAFNTWLWRQQRTGCELPHGGILQSWGTPGVGYTEIVEVERARRVLEPIFTHSSPAPAEIAITWSDRGRAMLLTEPLGARPGFAVDFLAILSDWHRRLLDLGYHRDLRFEGASLKGLKLLITPAMPAVTSEFLDRVQAWVVAGGIWIVAPLTGVRTPDHTAHTDAGLGRIEALAGVESVFGFPITLTSACGQAFGGSAEVGGWCMALRPTTSETKILGTLHGSPADGLAFITERPVGRGAVVMLTAQPLEKAGGALLDHLTRHCAARAGIGHMLPTRSNVLIAPRVTTDGNTLWVAINFSGESEEITVPENTIDTVSSLAVQAGPLRLEAYGYRVLQLSR